MISSAGNKSPLFEKIFILQKRTDWFCEQLKSLGIPCYRNPFSNIVTMEVDALSAEIAANYGLVPDDHHKPNWFKVVIMDHVEIEKLEALINAIKSLQIA